MQLQTRKRRFGGRIRMNERGKRVVSREKRAPQTENTEVRKENMTIRGVRKNSQVLTILTGKKMK